MNLSIVSLQYQNFKLYYNAQIAFIMQHDRMNNDNYLDDDANDCECDKGDGAFVLIHIQMISKI